MQFILLNFPGEKAETRTFPDREAMTGIMKYTAELRKAGVLLALGGFKSTSVGARVTLGGGKPTITDGPFSEAKELIGGYWLIQVSSKAEAVEWAARGPAAECEMIEVRQLYAPSDFPEEFRQRA